jgi:amidophosphoribosyltransferase
MTESPKECEKTFIPNMNASMQDPLQPNFDEDRLREYCGVFGVFDLDDASAITALGLHALQHRGQDTVRWGRWQL